MIMFTGSTATGKKVMAKAAETLTPVSLELGGKDPMVVLADADVERAANAAVYYSMLNGGQTCISVERVYVEAPVYDEFVAKVTEKARALRNDRSTGPGDGRRRLDDLPAAGRHRRAPRAATRVDKGARVRRRRRARPRRRRAATGSSRPCSSTSTTRWSACARRPSARRCRS